MSPTFPLTINNHTDLRVNVHTYQIDYSSYDENSTILHYIASLRPQHPKFPLALSYKLH